jgi:hypothetical protein
LKLEGIRRGSKNESCSLSLEEKDAKYTLLKTTRNKKKCGEKNWFLVNVLSIKENQTFTKLKNCS